MRDTPRVILITGAARGIGQAIARKLATEDTAFMLTDILEEALEATANDVRTLGAACKTRVVDVTEATAVRMMVEQTVTHFGQINAFFNNAGIVDVQPFLEATEDSWNRTLDVNAKGVFLCGQAVARQMVTQGNGRIVNTASVAARVGVPDMTAYAASKAAVMSLTRSMALALAPHGITVNALAPGIVDTDMWDKIDAERGQQRSLAKGEAMAERIAHIPLNRAADAADVASVAEFLVSDAAQYVTGQTINIDGGMRHD
ncbi:MAG: SDR family oxidoreductase [Chromatiales bacterium]|nr:SDR family oxidoreductase [Chromatiales bacterium]